MVFCTASLNAYPTMSLDFRDPVFKQYQQEMEQYHRLTARGQDLPPLIIFQVTVPENMDLLSLSARLGHRYDTIATLNRFDRSTTPVGGKTLLVPSQPGLFLYQGANQGLQNLIRQGRIENSSMVEIKVKSGEVWTSVLFMPGEAFNPVERAYFLGILRLSPLDGLLQPVSGARISSKFGMRRDPFSGHPAFHNGVDLAAPEGTPVRSAASGKVIFAGERGDYGNLVVIQHENGYETWYGHLKTIHVRLNQEVNSGYLLGEVGSTGRSTGPHLHFEVRKNGRSQNPVPYWR
jgi:murein DD-endopeptidase MepM/ murein hydrolase activator NlpD